MSIEPTGASHAQNPPAACFEWLEALAYWRAVKGERSMHGESIAESPSGTDGTWPNALPLMMVADLQWRTSGGNADHRMTLVNLASALYGALQRVAWTVPECYREPGNVVTMDAITAPQAKAIFTGMGVEPDRVLKAWIAHHCPANTEPAPQPAPTAETVPAKKETAEERQDRRLKMCIDAGLVFLPKAMQRLPDGVGDVADREGVRRQTFSADLQAALKRKYPETRPKLMQAK